MKDRPTLSKRLCWLALACLVVPMFASYFFDDMFSSLSQLFDDPAMLQLGWNAQDYGFYASGYSFLCVWGGLIVGGILLDLYGVRAIGSTFVGLMVGGAALVLLAITRGFAPRTSLLIAYAGCMLFGLGSEIAGVAVTRSIAKWFKDGPVAFAMGAQVAIARLGTAAALILSPVLVAEKASGEVYTLVETARPATVGLALLMLGAILWAVFVALDARFDAAAGLRARRGEVCAEDRFQFSDIVKLITNPRFVMMSLLCVFFYCCVISFKKFGTSIVIPRFDMDPQAAGKLVSLIPFFAVPFTPLFGHMVDRMGQATRWIIVGAALVGAAHCIIAFAPQGVPFYGYLGVSVLGIGYSLVPSAMWPSVPKIVPERNLGTAYSLIYWVQNMGLLLVPIFIGRIRSRTITDAADTARKLSAAVSTEYIFIGLGCLAVIVALLLRRTSRRHPELSLDAPNRK